MLTPYFVNATFLACVGITLFVVGVLVMREIKFIGSNLLPREIHLTATTLAVAGIVVLDAVGKSVIALAITTLR